MRSGGAELEMNKQRGSLLHLVSEGHHLRKKHGKRFGRYKGNARPLRGSKTELGGTTRADAPAPEGAREVPKNHKANVTAAQ